MATEKGDLLQGTLDMLVLKALRLEPMHGWGITERIEQWSESVLQLGQGTLYPALYRLERQDLIRSEWKITENNRRARFYSMTRGGRKQLQTEADSWARTVSMVNRLLEGTRAFLQPIAQQKQIRIEIECEPKCHAVADYELLHRMLLNLVLNALRETPTDGRVRLSGRVAGSDVFLGVEDTGPGIPAEKLTRIFDPMFSTSRDGCGLGLPIVKRIVESHKGNISIESSRGGTRFLIAIPHNQRGGTGQCRLKEAAVGSA